MVSLFRHQKLSLETMAQLEAQQHWGEEVMGFVMPTQTGVLANDIGSGKTFTVLWHLHESAQRIAARSSPVPPLPYPTPRLWCRYEPGTLTAWSAWATPERVRAQAGWWSRANVVVCSRALVTHWHAEWCKDPALAATVPIYCIDEPADLEGVEAWKDSWWDDHQGSVLAASTSSSARKRAAPAVHPLEPLVIVSDALLVPWLETLVPPAQQRAAGGTPLFRRIILDDIHVCTMPGLKALPWVLMAGFIWVVSSTPDEVTKWMGRRTLSFPQVGFLPQVDAWVKVKVDTEMAASDVEPTLVHRVRCPAWFMDAPRGPHGTAVMSWTEQEARVRRVLQSGSPAEVVQAVLPSLHSTWVDIPTWMGRWLSFRLEQEREAEAMASQHTLRRWQERVQTTRQQHTTWMGRWNTIKAEAAQGAARVCPICQEEPGSQHKDLPSEADIMGEAAAAAATQPAGRHPLADVPVEALTVWTSCCQHQFCAPCWLSWFGARGRGTADEEAPPPGGGGRRRPRSAMTRLVDDVEENSRPRTRARTHVEGGQRAGGGAGALGAAATGRPRTRAAVARSQAEGGHGRGRDGDYDLKCPFCRAALASVLGDVAWSRAASTVGQVPSMLFVCRNPLEGSVLPRPMEVFKNLLKMSDDVRLLIVTDQHWVWEAFRDMWAEAVPTEPLSDVAGTARQIQKKLEAFRTGKTRALFLNADVNSAGIHLPEATDVCLLHDFDPSMTRQIIGRAARFPRPAKMPLRVHRLEFV